MWAVEKEPLQNMNWNPTNYTNHIYKEDEKIKGKLGHIFVSNRPSAADGKYWLVPRWLFW